MYGTLKNIINIHIYLYMDFILVFLNYARRGGWILNFSVGLAMVERGWEGGTSCAKREAKEMNMRAK